MAGFLRERDIEGVTVLEIGGGVGEIEIELLKAGAARAENLELSSAYEEEARTLAEEAGLGGRIDWRLHDIAEDPEGVEPADIVVMHRVVCCYPDYERLLGTAADHARRALVFSYPPRNVLSHIFYGVFNLVMRLMGRAFGASPTRRAPCSPCSSGAACGRRTSTTVESGRSPGTSALRNDAALGARVMPSSSPSRVASARHRDPVSGGKIRCAFPKNADLQVGPILAPHRLEL